VDQRQVNIRLPADAVAVLEVAAFLEGKSIAEFLKPVMAELVELHRGDPAVETALRLRAERAAQNEGKLSSLESRRRRRRTADE
jgi:hypothetical protein